ncbi:MAG TPA: S1-like domain-containing RNA-binding protein [Patescibacteria group bacterium]|nr:S1-like domain-containing RNA-binding protein [Patescibacteria group bacterium]
MKTEDRQPGRVVTLTVARSSELGAFLDAGTGDSSDDILLHRAQQTRDVAVGEEIPVYLYLDPKGRLTASMRLPQMKEGQVARVRVINTSADGAFVDIGAERGVFMPFAGMRGKLRKGDMVWVKLYTDKSGRPAVTMEVEDELRRASRPADGVKVGDMLTASVYNITAEGAFLFTAERYIAFMHHSEMPVRPKVGEEIGVRVIYLREDGRLNVSTRPLKQDAMDQDAEKVLMVLRSRGGSMPYGDDSPAEVIKDKFGISKSSFKRALGRLMKSGQIRQQEGWTYLEDEAESLGKEAALKGLDPEM